MAEIKSIVYTYYIFFIGYAVDKHLGQFWSTSVVKYAIMNKDV